jgi:ABC-type amino acid transport substrate-binding protein
MARKDLGLTKVADLKGLRIGNQSGSSTGNTFVDIIAPRAGDVDPGFPSDLRPYLVQTAEGLLGEKKIAAVPDLSQALRPQFMERART